MMIFERNEDWRSYVKYYKVTSLLLAANIIMYILVIVNGGTDDLETMLRFGAMLKVDLFVNETWRMFASMFLHANFEHLLFNMFTLFVFAPPLERVMGHLPYAVLYIASGFVGNVVSNWGNEWGTLSVGASGAIYGLFGAYLFVGLFYKQAMDFATRKTLGVILVIGILQTFLIDSINQYAHFGGLAAGFVLFWLLRRIR
ncbi:rhomboid family intramembrane serine protease [Paenibacillus assamensis]|uniref:rhomboid family intramembrane serine protease n=1 Tax=Paenibacillus assamensis TaxID=311244 RepID=UPI00316AD5D6